jgi:hypothetical protein
MAQHIFSGVLGGHDGGLNAAKRRLRHTERETRSHAWHHHHRRHHPRWSTVGHGLRHAQGHALHSGKRARAHQGGAGEAGAEVRLLAEDGHAGLVLQVGGE